MSQKLTLLCLFFTLSCFSQQDSISKQKYRLYFDTGLYKTSYFLADEPGMFLQAGAGLKINKHFWLNFDIIHFESKGEDPDVAYFYSTATTATSTWMYMPNFSKDFIFSQKHQLTATLGFFFLTEYESRPRYTSYVEGDTEYLDFYMTDYTEIDLGLFLSAAYKYRLNSNILIGLQVSSYVQLYLGPEAFMIGPSLEFRL